ncbi:MAG TPA: hypothetical protein PLP07_13215 [Pyrinomonadaceae bacterium]|nr:hypothetical protein [Chloracidobacterium sp.]MBP9936397.1 hypothetical protein [Pyrinomonadaceae bacterium]HQX56882.1 hypothetical protein [Pyrinomonadaceae bacterium]HRA39533.1 hypothetical protein [Pyrinomonadaceae bacterium]
MRSMLFGLLVVVVATAFVNAQKLKPEEVAAKNLESIGTPEARAAAKTLIAVGTGTAKFLSNADLQSNGRIVIASEGTKFFLGINLESTSNRFADELYTFDGSNSSVGLPRQGNRSALGNFVQSNKMTLEQGLLGGSLSTAWVIANIAENKGKLSFDGTKKIDGKEAYVLGYSKKGGGDVDVSLYFDKDTFRHVRTEYKRMSSAGIGLRPEDSTKYDETRFKIIEEFGDFRAESGLTLPHTYRIVYSTSGQRGTTEIEWKFTLTEFAANQKLEASTFKAP